jgi:hypothetical protein
MDRIEQEFFRGVELRSRTTGPAAIVDANDRQVAWAVGYSRGLDRRRLEALMCDNPAGNQDQQTPIVIVRGACRDGVGSEAVLRPVGAARHGLWRAAVVTGAAGLAAVVLVFLVVHGSFWRIHRVPGPRAPTVPLPRPLQVRNEGESPWFCGRVLILMCCALAARRGGLAGLCVTPGISGGGRC